MLSTDEKPLDQLSLICEGHCNPEVHEIDRLIDNMLAGRSETKSYVFERQRALKHTTHYRVTDFPVYHGVIGWHHRWKCTICGYTRRF